MSEDVAILEKIATTIKRKIELVSIDSLINLGDKNIEIIFDNNFVCFKEIITQMQQLKDSNFTFKIRPKHCNYIIGSNFSDGKGEVLLF